MCYGVPWAWRRRRRNRRTRKGLFSRIVLRFGAVWFNTIVTEPNVQVQLGFILILVGLDLLQPQPTDQVCQNRLQASCATISRQRYNWLLSSLAPLLHSHIIFTIQLGQTPPHPSLAMPEFWKCRYSTIFVISVVQLFHRRLAVRVFMNKGEGLRFVDLSGWPDPCALEYSAQRWKNVQIYLCYFSLAVYAQTS